MLMTKYKSKCILWLAVVLLTISACKPSVPKGVISPGDMEDILCDYHVAISMASNSETNDSREFNETMYLQTVFKKHGVTEAEFDSSLVYYYSQVEQFVKIYGNVVKRLNDDAISIGASVGEIGQFNTFSLSGDTANIWNDATALLMMPYPGYNRVSFEMEADSTFRKGDAFQFNMLSHYMYKSGMKDALLYMAITYGNDSISTHSAHCTTTGVVTLRIPAADDQRVKKIRTFIYLSPSNENDVGNLLFLDQLQLIRFHKKATEEKSPDGAKRDSASIERTESSAPASDENVFRARPLRKP